jgi:hypothetical protein
MLDLLRRPRDAVFVELVSEASLNVTVMARVQRIESRLTQAHAAPPPERA